MTRRDVLAWLEGRRPVPPDALRVRLEAAVTDEPGPLPDHLALLGRRLLAAVSQRAGEAGGGGGRELALELLAADAFITYAFEAQAEADVAGVADLAGRVGAEGGEAA